MEATMNTNTTRSHESSGSSWIGKAQTSGMIWSLVSPAMNGTGIIENQARK